MRFHVASLVVAVAALAVGDATQLEAGADQHALLRNRVRSEMARPRLNFKNTVNAVAGVATLPPVTLPPVPKATLPPVPKLTLPPVLPPLTLPPALPKIPDLVTPVGQIIDGPLKGAITYTVDGINNYVENRLVDDLKMAAEELVKQLNNLACVRDESRFALTLVCAYQVQAQICLNTGGAAPGCLPWWTFLVKKILVAVGQVTFSFILRCTFYHIFKQLPGLCRGRAFGIAGTIANFAVADPYTSVCTIVIGCSCGLDTCTFACQNEEQTAQCYGDTYADAFKDMLEALA